MDNQQDNQTTVPPRPDNWSLADEGFEKVPRVDYNGAPYDQWQPRRKDLGAAWASFRELFRGQPPRPTAPGNVREFKPPLEVMEWRETNPE